VVISALLALVVWPQVADTSHCAAAARFLRAERHMIAEVEVDTIDDWRTQKRVPGCRITAAGGSELGVNREAVHFYELLRAAKWVRTPEPRDSPNEGSLRFRWEQADCLFNINAEALLGTDAEQRVNDTLQVPAGQTRYQIFVMCMPAMPAAPR
jgi:hypothetical protein